METSMNGSKARRHPRGRRINGFAPFWRPILAQTGRYAPVVTRREALPAPSPRPWRRTPRIPPPRRSSAFTAVPNYREFERAVKAAAAAEPGFLGALKWLERHGPVVVAQASTRTLAGPNSTGGCEATLGQISRRLAARTARMTNRARLRRLLALMEAEINGEADEQAWTERIQETLLASQGRAAPQRSDDDPAGNRVAAGAAPRRQDNSADTTALVGLPPALVPPAPAETNEPAS
jgi:hypothetical protein